MEKNLCLFVMVFILTKHVVIPLECWTTNIGDVTECLKKQPDEVFECVSEIVPASVACQGDCFTMTAKSNIESKTLNVWGCMDQVCNSTLDNIQNITGKTGGYCKFCNDRDDCNQPNNFDVVPYKSNQDNHSLECYTTVWLEYDTCQKNKTGDNPTKNQLDEIYKCITKLKPFLAKCTHEGGCYTMTAKSANKTIQLWGCHGDDDCYNHSKDTIIQDITGTVGNCKLCQTDRCNTPMEIDKVKTCGQTGEAFTLCTVDYMYQPDKFYRCIIDLKPSRQKCQNPCYTMRIKSTTIKTFGCTTMSCNWELRMVQEIMEGVTGYCEYCNTDLCNSPNLNRSNYLRTNNVTRILPQTTLLFCLFFFIISFFQY